MVTDSNGSGKINWSFSDADDDFDFLSKNQTLTLTYDIKVSDNHGGTAIQTVKVTVTGTDDKPVFNMTTVATVTEQPNHTLSLTPDTVHIALNFTDDDLTNTGHTATVLSASATGERRESCHGNAELMSFFNIDNVVKNSGSSAGTINTTFSATDLAFDYLAAGEHLNITYVVQLDDHAGGVSTQNVQVTVVGTNDKPFYLSGPESAHLIEGQNVDSSGNLHATGDLLFTDIDLSDTHTVSTTVTATRSGGGAIPLTTAQMLAAFSTALTPDSTGHLIGDVDWHFALNNNAASFLAAGETLTLTYHVAVKDPSRRRIRRTSRSPSSAPTIRSSSPAARNRLRSRNLRTPPVRRRSTPRPRYRPERLTSPMPTPAIPTPSQSRWRRPRAAPYRRRHKRISRRRFRPRCTIPPVPAPEAWTGISTLPTMISTTSPTARR